ncbi:MAG: flagellar biosynthetic protein FliO [Methylococcales bacterium]|nr:flagellar biosynthetic protein FliO [Methylococcales bacterium]MBT7410705.1 flagellar biosynthetic protein FliO [Methylococcales bacterium]
MASEKLFQVSYSLVIVIAIILTINWLFKKYGQIPTIKKNKSIKLLDTLSVGVREKVILIEAENQRFLLSVTSSRIDKLHAFPKDLHDHQSIKSENKEIDNEEPSP